MAESRAYKTEELVKLPFRRLQEAELERAVQESDTAASADLAAAAAAARFNRVKTIDPTIMSRLEKVFSNEPSDYACRAAHYIASGYDSVRAISGEIPSIRETDSAQRKKSKVDTIIRVAAEKRSMAEIWTSFMELLETACPPENSAENEHLIYSHTAWLQLLDQLMEEAGRYQETISGIYASKEKHRAVQKTLDEIKEIEAVTEKDSSSPPGTNALERLESLTGLNTLKTQIQRYVDYLTFMKKRAEEGYTSDEALNLNMVITGSPGTGKTTIARILADIYYELGLLPSGHLVETDRSRLVSGYVGQTEEKTLEAVEQARGGVLFIDEAPSLVRSGSENDYGQSVIDTLVSQMTSGAMQQTAVILAGYEEEMHTLLEMNAGLRSRFPDMNQFHLPDYSLDELVEIAEKAAVKRDFVIAADALPVLKQRLDKSRVDNSFGNARTAEQIVDEAVFFQGAEAAGKDSLPVEQMTMLFPDAFQRESSETGDPEAELEALIGLDSVKKQVRELSAFVHLQKRRQSMGMPELPLQLHAVFLGPPGTGKTTVAALYSRILAKLGLLKRGHLLTVGRGDLVASYTGQTAGKTKKKVREALGGVLFIDEAYSLLSDAGTGFGREAVDTLVEEMTKHGSDLVIIAAGYDESMQALLRSNPGLSSRFKHILRFPDFSDGELQLIFEREAAKFSMTLGEGAQAFLQDCLKETAVSGNARTMVDLFERTMQKQAARLFDDEAADITCIEKIDIQQAWEELQDGGNRSN